MEKNNEYITVAEFAKRANVSRQTIYNALQSKLTDYVKEIDNVKMLNIAGLSLFIVKEQSNLDNGLTVKLDNELSNLDTDLTAFLQRQIEEKDKQIERLQSRIEEDCRRIEEKDTQIKDNAEHIKEQEKRLADLLAQSQQLNYNNQVLLKEKNNRGFFKRLFAPKDKE